MILPRPANFFFNFPEHLSITASVLFSLSARFLKKFTKIIPEELHPCRRVLEYPHQFFFFQIYCLNFILGGLDIMGMKSDGFLKGT